MIDEWPRPCVLQSDALHIDGLCYGIDRRGLAIVEAENGAVNIYDLTSHVYSIRFTDRRPKNGN